jgi:phosphatidylserine decarboxylase
MIIDNQRMTGMSLTPYGRRELTIGSAAMTGLLAASLLAAWRWGWWWAALVAVPLPLWAWALWFFRDPTRTPPEGEGLFVSPADGHIADITPIGADGPLGAEGVRIGIFMSVMDVHVNRCPQAAVVVKVERRKGVFLDARDPEASERNESATITLKTPLGGRERVWMVRQVAGLIARRIVTDASAGRAFERGERMGMIKFGSRLELMVGRDLADDIRVRVGQKVRAGETVLIARR